MLLGGDSDSWEGGLAQQRVSPKQLSLVMPPKQHSPVTIDFLHFLKETYWNQR